MPRFIECWIWTIHVCWWKINGRWFIFRDAPFWFVVLATKWDNESYSDETSELGQEAQKELLHRLNLLERKLDQGTPYHEIML